jgi:hypothetical protein
VPGKVEHVDPGGAEPGGQLLQRGPALLQPLRGLAGLALDFLELGPQLLRRGLGRVQLLAQGGQPCLQGLVLARVVRVAGLGGLVAAHLLLLGIERLELLVRARQILTRGGRGAGDRPERAGQPVQPFEDDLQAKVTVGHQRLLSVSGERDRRAAWSRQPIRSDRAIASMAAGGQWKTTATSAMASSTVRGHPCAALSATKNCRSRPRRRGGPPGPCWRPRRGWRGSVMRGSSTPSASTLSWPRSTRASPRNSPALGLRI